MSYWTPRRKVLFPFIVAQACLCWFWLDQPWWVPLAAGGAGFCLARAHNAWDELHP